jgi:hypothetical protein
VPAQQSNCEIHTNQLKAQHPHSNILRSPWWFGGTPPPQPPAAYRDAPSGIVFYVESDGRHLAAIDAKGRLLWVRNPFVEANLCPYRSAHPYISHLDSAAAHSPPTIDANTWITNELYDEMHHGRMVPRPERNARFVYLEFNSSQYGYVNISDGYFYPMGQN